MSEGIVEQLQQGLQTMIESLRRTPWFVWIYIGIVLYFYRRMSRDFVMRGQRAATP
jgi:hypothetical protein